MKKLLLFLIAVLFAATIAWAQTSYVNFLGGPTGWYSDDTRDATGADLVGLNLTHFGKPGQTPTAADDIAIAQQISFVAGPGGVGTLKMDKGYTTGNSKCTASKINLTTGFASSDNWLADFKCDYRYYTNSTAELTIPKIGVQSTAWVSSQAGFTAQRSGESSWDIILVDWRGTDPGWSVGSWAIFTTDKDTPCWRIYRQAGNGYHPATPAVSMSLQQIKNDLTWGPLIFGTGAKVTNFQFGVGSSTQTSTSYIDYVETNLLNGGNRVDFIAPPTPTTYISPASTVVCGNYNFEVKVQDFTNVAAISLVLNYDYNQLGYITFTQNSVFSAPSPVILLNSATPGKLVMSYANNTGVTLADDAVLLTLNFNLLPSASGIPTALTWSTVPGECEYAAPGLDGQVYGATFTDLTWTIPVRPVKNMNTGLEYCTIQAAISDPATNNNLGDLDDITVDATLYTAKEQVLVNKEVTITGINGKPIVEFLGTVTGKPTLFDISANNVTIDNINFSVDLAKLRSAIIASGAGIDYIAIKDNVIDCYGVPSGAYGDRNAVSVNFSGNTNYRVAMGGVDNVVFTGNTVNFGTQGGFRSGISADEVGGTFSGNTLATINQDIQVRFGSNGNITIENNNLNGGGIELAEHNAGAGIITVAGNTFDATISNTIVVPRTAILRLKNNQQGKLTNVTGNEFNNHLFGISLENYKNVTIDANEFTPLANATDYVHIGVNTKSISSNSNTIVQTTIDGAFTNNVFNGSVLLGGVAIGFYNHDSDNASFGTFTIGTASNENTFNEGIGQYIYLDNQAGSSNGATTPTTYPTTGAWPTTMVPWAVDLNIENNLFATSTPFALEDKVFHAMDFEGLGLVTWVPSNVYVTTNTLGIQRGVDVSSTNWTVNVGDGEYHENVVIDVLNLTLVSAGGPSNTTIFGAQDGIGINLKSNGATVNGFYVYNFESGITIESSGNSIINNIIKDNTTYGILMVTNVVPYENNQITNNTIQGNNAGIMLEMGSSKNTTIQGNVIKEYAEGISIWQSMNTTVIGNAIEGTSGSIGIFILESDGNSISNNLIFNNGEAGVSLYIDGYTNTVLENNSIYNNLLGIITEEEVSATCNWWGTNTVAGVAALISGPAIYDPWLVNGTDNSTDPGFQPVPGSCSGATNLYVNDLVLTDDSYTTAIGDDNNNGTASAPFLTITKAVITAVDGTKIWVDAGTFQEQVSIGKTVDITGVDRTMTIVKAPVTMATVVTPNGTNDQPIIYASGAGNIINISNITIDGDGGRNVGRFFGIEYFAADGTFDNNRITGIRGVVFNGAQAGIALFVTHLNNTSLNQNVTVSNNLIDDYQKGGIVINAINTQGIVTANIITGQNLPNVTAQNGIQISRGAWGSVTGNTVTGNIWNKVEHPHVYMASGILLYGIGVDNTGTSTGKTTTVSGNTLTGNEAALMMQDGSIYNEPYTPNYGLSAGINDFQNNKVHVRVDDAAQVNVGNTYDKKVLNPDQTNIVFGCIQYAIDEAASGNVLNASAHTFVENVVVHTPVTINGAGMASTTVIPAISAPNICSGASLCAGASNIFLVQASDVTIQNLTSDGNNPEISSGVTSNGIDVDARNGIITDYLNFPSTVFNNLNVNHVTIKNIYLRGINNYKGTGFYFHDNIVINVAGESSSIAMFNSQGAGSFTGNHVDLANDGLASNHSKGTTYTGNTVTNSGSGIHTDNNGSGGGTADIMEGNNVSNTSWGIWVFVPYKDVQVNNNTVTNCDVGLASVGQYVSVLPSFTGNTIDGTSKSGSIGVYTSTSTWYYASGNSNHTFTNNFIKNNDYGIYIESEAGFTNTTTAKSNSVTGNTNGVEVDNSGTLNIDLTCNWWGTADGNLIAPMISGNVDYIPWLEDGTDSDLGTPGFQPVPGSCTGAPDYTGNYKYFNNGFTPLSNINVELWKGNDKVYPVSGTVTTDASGNFTFANVYPDTYEVRSSTSKPVGGINSTDAAQVNYWVVNNSEIEKVRFYAGDVTNDNDILSLDASNIQGYFLTSGSAGFVRAPWSFWTAGETISANSDPGGYPTLVVPGTGSTVTQNFYGLVTGDFNRSFTPGAKDSGSGSITLQYGQMTEVAYNETVELPIVSLQDMKVGAVSLILGFPSELMEIENVFLGEDLTNPVPFNVSGDELRVSWHTLSPVSLNAGDRLVTLMVSVTGDAGDEGILFTLAADPLNELADGSYEVIANAVLSIDILKTSALGIASNNISDMLNLSNYPNPFKGSTTFTYALPVDGRVTLEIYDMVGSKMTVLVDEVQSAGNYRINMNESMLPSGVYTAKIQLQSSGTVSSRVIKIINR